jgi:hypothetical protein
VSNVSNEKPVLGFNVHALKGFFLSVSYIAVAPLFMLLMPTAPALSFLVVILGTIFWVRLTKSFFFWTLQSGLWSFFFALMLSTNGGASKNQKAFEGKTPISAQSLASTPVTGGFLLIDASLDNQIRGSHRVCKEVDSFSHHNADLEYYLPSQSETRCTQASVTALTIPASTTGDSAESVIVAWVVRDHRSWPRYFGDTDDPMPLTTSSGGVFSPGSAVPEKAREQACKNLAAKESLGREVNVQSCPIDAPLFWTVDIEPMELTVKSLLPLTTILIGFHSVIAWIIVLITVLKRAFR